jgi:hypothetical protein
MNNDEDNDEASVLEIIPSNQLRLIPLYCVITHIYKKIIEKASLCEYTYAFNIDRLIQYYAINPKIATPSNKMFIINEIKMLFPGIKISEKLEKYCVSSQYNSHWCACWEEEDELYDGTDIESDGKWETENDDDIMLNQAIKLSLNEVNKTERQNNSISIMGQKAEERLQKSRQKYKKLYNKIGI